MYYSTYLKDTTKKQEDAEIVAKSAAYLSDFLTNFKKKVDIRYSYSFFDLFMGILSFRENSKGLLLSELGGYVNGHQNAPAGTKRISNLLRNEDWQAEDIAQELLNKTEKRLTEKGQEGKQWLLLWDDSVLEKHESWRIEGLCPVPSSKAKRLTKIKPGYYEKMPRINVPGMQWSASVLTSETDTPSVCQMSWWTTKGYHKTCRDDVFYTMLKQASNLIKRCNATVCHIFDRGYANAPTLEKLFKFDQTFIIRFKSILLLKDREGVTKNTYRFSTGKRALSCRSFYDKERKCYRKVSILYVPVTHPEWDDKQLYLVIVRDKTNKTQPMYLLTNELIDTVGMAWATFKRYMKRWDIEQTFRAAKSSLGIQSLRLWFWENRLKLLFIVTLVLDFLLLIISKHRDWGNEIIRTWRPRTGTKHKEKSSRFPFYELRAAISLLLLFLMNHMLFLKKQKSPPKIKG